MALDYDSIHVIDSYPKGAKLKHWQYEAKKGKNVVLASTSSPNRSSARHDFEQRLLQTGLDDEFIKNTLDIVDAKFP